MEEISKNKLVIILKRVQTDALFDYHCVKCNKGYKQKHWWQKHQKTCNKSKQTDAGFETFNKQLQSLQHKKIKTLKIMQGLKQKQMDIDSIGTADPRPAFLNKMNQCQIFKNKYFKNLEGNQATKYIKQWHFVSAHISSTSYFIYFYPVIQAFDVCLSLCSKSLCDVSQSHVDKLKQICYKLQDSFVLFVDKVETIKTFSLGAKFHYIFHQYQFMNLWRLSIGYEDEQSTERYNQICSDILERYKSQRGVLRVKYFVNHMMLITSPKYV